MGRINYGESAEREVLILPAIDIRGGQCVRLRQGDFSQTITNAAGQSFNLGVTTVSYLATDTHGNTAAWTFGNRVVAGVTGLLCGCVPPNRL